MFGRRLNTFKNYSGTKSDPMKEEEMIEKAKLLVDVVYPISSKAADYNDKLKEYFSSRKRVMEHEFPIGSKVMLKNLNRTKKSSEVYVGPYEIVKCDDNGSYTLKDVTGELYPNKVTPKLLKRIKEDEIEDDASYEVEKIINHRGAGEKREYLVRWKGCSSDHDSWEPVSNFDTLEVIEKYNAAKNSSKKQCKKKRSGRSHRNRK